MSEGRDIGRRHAMSGAGTVSGCSQPVSRRHAANARRRRRSWVRWAMFVLALTLAVTIAFHWHVTMAVTSLALVVGWAFVVLYWHAIALFVLAVLVATVITRRLARRRRLT